MPTYAWSCQTCGETVVSIPASWPSLESAHRLLHSLEARIDRLTAALRRRRGAELGIRDLAAPSGPGPLPSLGLSLTRFVIPRQREAAASNTVVESYLLPSRAESQRGTGSGNRPNGRGGPLTAGATDRLPREVLPEGAA